MQQLLWDVFLSRIRKARTSKLFCERPYQSEARVAVENAWVYDSVYRQPLALVRQKSLRDCGTGVRGDV